jgi:hypothetical protein
MARASFEVLTHGPGNKWKIIAAAIRNPCSVLAAGTQEGAAPIRLGQELIPMLMIKERRPAIRTLRGWGISVLQEAGAIRECELHGWIQDRADPHARQRAPALAEEDPPPGVSSAEGCRRNP